MQAREPVAVLGADLGKSRQVEEAQVGHAQRPRRQLFAGQAGVVMMTELRGASNAKAKRELAWRPAHPSWREGFANMTAPRELTQGRRA
jgi:hypothetical protein